MSSPATPGAATAPDFAAVFADFAARLSIDNMPAEAIAAAKTNLFDTLACATAGVSAAGVGELRQIVTDWGGKREAAIWCSGDRVPAHHAAWVNGMMAHARDYDDTHDRAVLHAGVSVVPAAIAAAELKSDATGADLIAGIAAGLELVCRLRGLDPVVRLAGVRGDRGDPGADEWPVRRAPDRGARRTRRSLRTCLRRSRRARCHRLARSPHDATPAIGDLQGQELAVVLKTVDANLWAASSDPPRSGSRRDRGCSSAARSRAAWAASGIGRPARSTRRTRRGCPRPGC